MTKTLSSLSSMGRLVKANPALASGIALVLVTLGGRFGLGLDATQLAVGVSAVAAVLAGLTHATTSPAGKHEAAPREEHP